MLKSSSVWPYLVNGRHSFAAHERVVIHLPRGRQMTNSLYSIERTMYHAPRIQILTNQNARLRRFNCGCGLECSMTERDKNEHTGSLSKIKKSTKRASIFKVGEKVRFSHSHVHKTGSHVTFRIHIAHGT